MNIEDIFLVLEASTSDASVALITRSSVLASIAVRSRDVVTGTRLEGLALAIAELFTQTDKSPRDLSGIICASGPGGFTSLRGAAAIAKGMCSALNIPLYAVATPALVVAQAHMIDEVPAKNAQNAENVDDATVTYVVAQDAGREEMYTSLVRIHNSRSFQVSDVHIVPQAELEQYAAEQEAVLISPSFDQSELAAVAVHIVDRIVRAGPVDVTTWEPVYGRLAEAQVKWEAQHGRPLPV